MGSGSDSSAGGPMVSRMAGSLDHDMLNDHGIWQGQRSCSRVYPNYMHASEPYTNRWWPVGGLGAGPLLPSRDYF